MTATMSIAVFSIFLILAGLGIVWLSEKAGPASARIFWWVGIILAFIGLLFLFLPVLIWIAAQLHAMLGH